MGEKKEKYGCHRRSISGIKLSGKDHKLLAVRRPQNLNTFWSHTVRYAELGTGRIIFSEGENLWLL